MNNLNEKIRGQKLNLTVIILTFNEEINILECILSVKDIAARIVVCDSFSTDNTIHIAKKLGAEIYQNEFTSQAEQFNHVINVSDIKTNWLLRLDADERITEKSRVEITKKVLENETTEVNGFVIPFQVNFLGKSLKFGGIYPFRKMILFKYGKAKMENRRIDEHIYLIEGKSEFLDEICIHHDFKGLTHWIDKHNKYSTKEVLDYIDRYKLSETNTKLNKVAKFRRYFKYQLYYKLPLGFRALAYFIYRYFFRLGFLDGKPGLIFAVLQAFWYRFLVDAKLYELNTYKEFSENEA